MKGKLYLLPSPISENQGGMLSRPVEDALRQCHVLLCERIRTTRRFIKYLFTQAEFDDITFIEFNKHDRSSFIEEGLSALRNGKNVGILSEAGLPCIADPGHEFVKAAHANKIQVKPFVGPCSFMLALMASGLNGQQFSFHGYLPRDASELKQSIKYIVNKINADGGSHIVMETPYRNNQLLESMLHHVPHDIYLNISMDILGTQQYIATQTMSQWAKTKYVFKEKFPAVFILGK